MTCSRTVAAVFLGLAPGARAEGLDRLTWMAGTWTGEEGDVEMLEHWTDPKGGLTLGLHRDVRGGKAVFFEFLRIEATPKGIVYLASPKGAPATPFPAVEIGQSRVVFENRTHDFPQCILYWLAPDSSLHARIEGPKGGKTVSEEWTWKRAR